MQAARHLVGVAVELAPRVQLGHDNLRGGPLEFVVVLDAGRDAAAVVTHGYRIVRVDGHDDLVAVTRERLIDRVVHHLEHHVMQPGPVGGIPDVHARPLAHCLEAFEDLDAVRPVFVRIDVAFRLTHFALSFLLHVGAPQIRIGMTTYLNSGSVPNSIRALEEASPKLALTSEPDTLFRTSRR